MNRIKEFFTKLTNGEIIKVDKMLHFAFSFIIASFFLTPVFSMVAVLVANVLKELFDKYVKKTKFEVNDILAGLLGGAFYLLTRYLLLLL